MSTEDTPAVIEGTIEQGAGALFKPTGMSLGDLGKVFALSGYFRDAKNPSQAVVKMVYGIELGFGPGASMAGVHIIEGKPCLGGILIAAKIKGFKRPDGRSKYRYIVEESTRENCRIKWFERDEDDGEWMEVGVTEIDIHTAHESGWTKGKDGLKKNWRCTPEDMLYWRNIARGSRRFCPDVFGGAPVYTPDELGADDMKQADVEIKPAEDDDLNNALDGETTAEEDGDK